MSQHNLENTSQSYYKNSLLNLFTSLFSQIYYRFSIWQTSSPTIFNHTVFKLTVALHQNQVQHMVQTMPTSIHITQRTRPAILQLKAKTEPIVTISIKQAASKSALEFTASTP